MKNLKRGELDEALGNGVWSVLQRPAPGTSTTQRLARYETAQETIGLLAGMRSAWMAAESSSSAPDLEQIAKWALERTQFADEEEAMRFDDLEAVERVIATYGPIVKAYFAPSE